jgi:4-amino-4-deoxy-L-arabinose transferase-like glycosyltransferase
MPMSSLLSPAGRRVPAGVRSIPLPLLLLGALILARLLLAEVWLLIDEGVVDTESGRHLQRAWDAYLAMGHGTPFALFQNGTEYPPLMYLTGARGALVGGLDVESFIGAQDLFFVPALAIGVYGAGSVAYGRTAGVLAALFALGAPIVLSVFHMYLIDTPEMAMVALSIWAILATDRFSRTGVSVVAGVAVGFGMLAKQNFPLFVVGLILVVLLRGGWRHWRGLLAFLVVAAAISALWYWSEVSRTFDLIRGSSGPGTGTAGALTPTSGRWTVKNFGQYFWYLANVNLLTPMLLAAIGGAIALLVRFVRRRDARDVTPELIAGALVSYAGLTWISLKDPRYALPMTPYLAVLGTGWIPLLRVRWRSVAIGALGAIVALNLVMMLWGRGAPGHVLIKHLPGQSQGRTFTFWLPQGWIAGRPESSDAIVTVMRAAHADGIKAIAFDPGANQPRFNHPGLDILSRVAGIPIAAPYDPSDRAEAMIANRYPALPNVKPCGTLSDGTALYLSRGPVDGIPFEQRRFFCPRSLTAGTASSGGANR